MCSISLNLTGLDTESIIQQMMAIEKQPLLKLQTQQTVLATRKQAWDVIRTKTATLSSRLASLVNTSTFSEKTVSSSNSVVASATVNSSALDGSYDLRVTSLASSQITGSSLFDAPDSPLNIAGSVTLNGKAIEVSAIDSLNSLAAKINATADIGVKASVLQTEPSKYRLILTSTAMGTANEMAFGGDTGTLQALGLLDTMGEVNEIQAASDAVFTANGVQFTRESNTVSDAVPGLSLSLSQAFDPMTGSGGVTTLTVSNNDEVVVDCVKQFVVDYNTLIDTVKVYNSYDADTQVAGTLFGDPLLQRLLSALREVIFDRVAGGVEGYQSLSAAGISTGAPGVYSRDGKITLDETKLREALKTNRDAVLVLFGAKEPNVALASSGASVTASSTYGTAYSAEGVIDGSTSSLLWGQNGGWADGTAGEFPDSLEIDFGDVRTIDTVNLVTLDSDQYPADSFGVSDFNTEYWDSASASWISLFSVSDNTKGFVSESFSAVTTSKIRVNVTGSNDGQFSRILEVEAIQKNDGAFSRLEDVVETYTAADGLLLNRTAEIDRLDLDLSRQIENMQRRLDMRMESLKKKFTALEVMLQQFNSQSAWLSQQFQYLTDQQNG